VGAALCVALDVYDSVIANKMKNANGIPRNNANDRLIRFWYAVVGVLSLNKIAQSTIRMRMIKIVTGDSFVFEPLQRFIGGFLSGFNRIGEIADYMNALTPSSTRITKQMICRFGGTI
jgi:hypothetical protein